MTFKFTAIIASTSIALSACTFPTCYSDDDRFVYDKLGNPIYIEVVGTERCDPPLQKEFVFNTEDRKEEKKEKTKVKKKEKKKPQPKPQPKKKHKEKPNPSKKKHK